MRSCPDALALRVSKFERMRTVRSSISEAANASITLLQKQQDIHRGQGDLNGCEGDGHLDEACE